MERPYCACATPPGSSGIAVIRVAGFQAPLVVDKIFRLRRTFATAKNLVEMPGYTAAYGVIYDPSTDKPVDEVVCNRFVAPYSYTGEDLIEISCHGGLAVQQEIIRLLLENGARMAEPGEFTKSAFLAGKIDLSQAEAVMDVIAAESTLALSAAEEQLNGGIKLIIEAVSAKLYETFALLEMMVEFPEHDDTPENNQLAVARLKIEHETLVALGATYAQGRILKNGMTVVLAGRPNSGKSSLLNYFAGFERAIVTPAAGTTRDVLEVFSVINGIPVRLIDTAGIRETDDEIEQIGVSRAQRALKEADLVLWLTSVDSKDNQADSPLEQLFTQISTSTGVIILLSKKDLHEEAAIMAHSNLYDACLKDWGVRNRVRLIAAISAVTGEGATDLGKEIARFYQEQGGHQQAAVLLTSNRHFLAVKGATAALEQAISALESGLSADFACSSLRHVLESLGEITGSHVSDTLVDTIFSRFCIGK